jgi:hypothetical protein
MWLLPRLRFIFGRRPYLYWLLAGGCALLIAARLHGLETAAQRSAAAWGTARTVWVNVGDALPGSALHPVARHYPAAMLPGRALTSVPANARAARVVGDGQVLVAADLAGGDTPPADWVVVAVPIDHAPHLVPGDRVMLLHGEAPACDGISTDVRGERVEVAVPTTCAAAVSADISTIVVARHTVSTYGAPDDRP